MKIILGAATARLKQLLFQLFVHAVDRLPEELPLLAYDKLIGYSDLALFVNFSTLTYAEKLVDLKGIVMDLPASAV